MYEDCVLQSMRFPHKLWRIVNECQSGAIRWGANGDTILLDYKRFQAEYLDTRRPIFKTSNITSFIRQLNLYGFRKVTAHGRDPIGNCHDSHAHEFLHNNFRAERADLLSQVCRKTSSKGKCFQYDMPRNADGSPRSEANCVSRLKLCQLALTKTLEQITEEYRHEQEERSIIAENDALKRIRISQNTGTANIKKLYHLSVTIHGRKTANLRVIKFNSTDVERNTIYSAFPLTRADVSSEHETISSSWYVAPMNTYSRHFNVQNTH